MACTCNLNYPGYVCPECRQQEEKPTRQTPRSSWSYLTQMLSLTGNWVNVTKAALLSRDLLPPGNAWFLGWSRYAVVWTEYHRTLWVSAHHLAEVEPNYIPDDLRRSNWRGPDLIRHQWVTAFRAMQEFPSRQALLHLVGFDVWSGKFGLMELMATHVDWRWNT